MTSRSEDRSVQLRWLRPLSDYLPALFRRQRQHDYSVYKCNVDYVFDAIDPLCSRGYMTGQGRGVKRGDFIILKQCDILVEYRVESIDYYSSPSEMWIALLSKVKCL